MKAAVLVGFGGLGQLEPGEMPEPEVGAGEVKVRVAATSINPRTQAALGVDDAVEEHVEIERNT